MGRQRKNPTPEQADAEIAQLAAEGIKKRRPRTAVLERRLQNPFGEPSHAVPFKDPTLSARWFNDDSRPGQVHRAKELGWVPVEPSMLRNLDAVGSHQLNPAGEITRGPRGQEVLMYMPTQDRDAIQRAKTEDNNRRHRVEKQHLVEALGQRNADAADFMDRHVGVSVETQDFVETRQILPEGLES